MANFLKNIQESVLTIPQVDDENGVTIYIVSFRIGELTWTVRHRYNHFVELFEKLNKCFQLEANILPPKKLLGNRHPSFIKQRQFGLQKFLLHLMYTAKYTELPFKVFEAPQMIPRDLALFMDFHKYDVFYLLQELAAEFSHKGNLITSKIESYIFNTFQLYAIKQQINAPVTPLQQATIRWKSGFDDSNDFRHILHVCNHLQEVNVEGSSSCLGSSNIIPNNYISDLNVFENIETLNLHQVSLNNIFNTCIKMLCEKLTSLTITKSGVKTLSQVLLGDKKLEEGNEVIWRKLKKLDLSQNHLKELDESIILTPLLTHFTANENYLTQLKYLHTLPHLTHISVIANKLYGAEDLQDHVGNLMFLDVSKNNIASLKSFSNLINLESLILNSNLISDADEVQHIKDLPKLHSLILSGKAVSLSDYLNAVRKWFKAPVALQMETTGPLIRIYHRR